MVTYVDLLFCSLPFLTHTWTQTHTHTHAHTHTHTHIYRNVNAYKVRKNLPWFHLTGSSGQLHLA